MLRMIGCFLLRKTGLMAFFSLMLLSVLSFSYNQKKVSEVHQMVASAESELLNYKNALRIDQARNAALTKILRIIDEYNPQMDPVVKRRVAGEIYDMSVKYDNLDVDLICATITHETALTWKENVISPAGALGLMQIMPRTGMFLSTFEGIRWTNAKDVLFDPVKNIRLGCRYLSTLIEMYHLDGGLAAYNGGETRAAKWLASGRDDQELFEETREYVPAVLKLYESYKN